MNMNITPDMMKQAVADTEASFQRAVDMHQADDGNRWWEDWLVTVPEYDANGVVIKRYDVSAAEEQLDLLRTAFNPQRPNRRVRQGTYTKLEVDGVLWMSDTPAEIVDLDVVDEAMVYAVPSDYDSSMLIVGLGIGLVLRRAIVHHGIKWIDVVEREGRVIDAVGQHYRDLAKEHEVSLRIHQADIHAWRPPKLSHWDLGWFDIWADINEADLPEVKRLRDRFRTRLGWFGAWAQADRLGQKKRIASGQWAY
jgi:hypothetical protein